MRISTSMLYESNISSLNNKTASLLNTQQQLSSGKRILKPSDDPVAASQVLETAQSMAVNTQYQAAQGAAKDTLGLIDSQLSTVSAALTRVRELGVQLGSATLTASDRKAIATELRSQFDSLMGIANSTDGNGQFLFSGYQGSSKPFAGSPENGVIYAGDDGQRNLQVSASRLMPVSVTGNDLFMDINNGNGVFVTAPTTAPINTGSGIIDAGTVTDVSKWDAASTVTGGAVEVRFWQDPVTTVRYYDLVDATGISMFTGAASTAGGAGNTFTHAYTSGNAIQFNGLAAPYADLGIAVTINGAPASGDSFEITPSTSGSMFAMLSDMINAAEMPANSSSAGNAQLHNQLTSIFSSLSMVEDNVLRVRADVGSRLGALDDLSSTSQGLDIQYQSRISGLQDVDYNKAITDLTRQQTELQATQQSFAKISKMSLFDFI